LAKVTHFKNKLNLESRVSRSRQKHEALSEKQTKSRDWKLGSSGKVLA
jgi:hypothetical protein